VKKTITVMTTAIAIQRTTARARVRVRVRIWARARVRARFKASEGKNESECKSKVEDWRYNTSFTFYISNQTIHGTNTLQRLLKLITVIQNMNSIDPPEMYFALKAHDAESWRRRSQ
jgi:hypothetical protein